MSTYYENKQTKMLLYFTSVAALIFTITEGAILGADLCTVTLFSQANSTAASCDTLTIGDLIIPKKTTLKITLKDGAKLVFTGHVTHEAAEWNGDLIQIHGKNVDISGVDSHILDGMGQQDWKGTNEPTIMRPKFIGLYLINSTVRNLYLKNCPENCFLLSNSDNVHIRNIHIDNKEGYPGMLVNHVKNTDGFVITGSSNILIEKSKVWNQNDCVAVAGGHNLVFNELQCNGSDGLSLSGDVYNVTFKNSIVKNAGNVIHVKTHKDVTTTGTIKDIQYQNITFSNHHSRVNVGIDRYIRSVQRSFPTGEAKRDVSISSLTLDALPVPLIQIDCATGACANFIFQNVHITVSLSQNTCENVPRGEAKGNVPISGLTLDDVQGPLVKVNCGTGACSSFLFKDVYINVSA